MCIAKVAVKNPFQSGSPRVSVPIMLSYSIQEKPLDQTSSLLDTYLRLLTGIVGTFLYAYLRLVSGIVGTSSWSAKAVQAPTITSVEESIAILNGAPLLKSDCKKVKMRQLVLLWEDFPTGRENATSIAAFLTSQSLLAFETNQIESC